MHVKFKCHPEPVSLSFSPESGSQEPWDEEGARSGEGGSASVAGPPPLPLGRPR